MYFCEKEKTTQAGCVFGACPAHIHFSLLFKRLLKFIKIFLISQSQLFFNICLSICSFILFLIYDCRGNLIYFDVQLNHKVARHWLGSPFSQKN